MAGAWNFGVQIKQNFLQKMEARISHEICSLLSNTFNLYRRPLTDKMATKK